MHFYANPKLLTSFVSVFTYLGRLKSTTRRAVEIDSPLYFAFKDNRKNVNAVKVFCFFTDHRETWNLPQDRTLSLYRAGCCCKVI